MEKGRLKYHVNLADFAGCPPAACMAVEREGYRWVHSPVSPEDFVPLALISPVNRRPIDESDLEMQCLSWGLSLFDSLQSAKARFESIIKNVRLSKRPSFIQQKGDKAALLQLKPQHGESSEPNNAGHFTLFEYDGAQLQNEIIDIFNIFELNGESK